MYLCPRKKAELSLGLKEHGNPSLVLVPEDYGAGEWGPGRRYYARLVKTRRGLLFLEQVLSDGIDSRLGTVGEVELAQDVADMGFHRVLAQYQLPGDLTVTASSGDEA